MAGTGTGRTSSESSRTSSSAKELITVSSTASQVGCKAAFFDITTSSGGNGCDGNSAASTVAQQSRALRRDRQHVARNNFEARLRAAYKRIEELEQQVVLLKSRGERRDISSDAGTGDPAPFAAIEPLPLEFMAPTIGGRWRKKQSPPGIINDTTSRNGVCVEKGTSSIAAYASSTSTAAASSEVSAIPPGPEVQTHAAGGRGGGGCSKLRRTGCNEFSAPRTAQYHGCDGLPTHSAVTSSSNSSDTPELSTLAKVNERLEAGYRLAAASMTLEEFQRWISIHG